MHIVISPTVLSQSNFILKLRLDSIRVNDSNKAKEGSLNWKFKLFIAFSILKRVELCLLIYIYYQTVLETINWTKMQKFSYCHI